jgi:hypothetical protein
MMKILIANAFSLNMLNTDAQTISVNPLSLEKAREYLKAAEALGVAIDSVVGHADTAAVLSSQLGRAVTPQRATVTLNANIVLLVGQYSGPRLEAGATELPEGARIQWFTVSARPANPSVTDQEATA